MKNSKCKFSKKILEFIDKTPPKKGAALMEHAASCPVCGPMLAAAMKTSDDARQDNLLKASGQLKAEVLDAALEELKKQRATGSHKWQGYLRPALVTATACVIVLMFVVIHGLANPAYQLESFNTTALQTGRGPGAVEIKPAQRECFNLGFNIERFRPFASEAASQDPSAIKTYHALVKKMRKSSDVNTIETLELAPILNNKGNTIPSGLDNYIRTIEGWALGFIDNSDTQDGREFYSLGQIKAALVNIKYGPSDYYPTFPDKSVLDGISVENNPATKRLMQVCNDILESPGRITPDQAMSFYKRFDAAEREYFD